MALALSALLASLAGSLHCAGMCGPFAAFWADAGDGGSRGGRAGAHVAYHGARLATYAALGAGAGAVGGAVDAALAGRMRAAAALVAGVALVAWGVVGLLRHAGVRWPALPVPEWAARTVTAATGALRARPPVQRAAAIGLLTTILPCGWLHAFVLAAAGTGSASRGGLLMVAFWAGTVPVLSALGAGALAVLGPLRRHAPALSATVVLLAGAATLWHHVRSLSTPAPCHEAAAPVPADADAGGAGP